MSKEDRTESEGSSPASSPASESQQASGTKPSSKKVKSSKPRLTASQKNFNHKDAENKRRTAIRERFTELSNLVPGAQGHERSEQIMLVKDDRLPQRHARRATSDWRQVAAEQETSLLTLVSQ